MNNATREEEHMQTASETEKGTVGRGPHNSDASGKHAQVDRLVADITSEVAGHPSLSEAISSAIKTCLPTIIEDVLQRDFAGESIRLYIRKRPATAKTLQARVRAALEQGTPAAVVARAEGISERHVRRIRATIE